MLKGLFLNQRHLVTRQAHTCRCEKLGFLTIKVSASRCEDMPLPVGRKVKRKKFSCFTNRPKPNQLIFADFSSIQTYATVIRSSLPLERVKINQKVL